MPLPVGRVVVAAPLAPAAVTAAAPAAAITAAAAAAATAAAAADSPGADGSGSGSGSGSGGAGELVGVTPYVEALRDAVAVLCPAGDDYETFRFWEALEAGAIPVVVEPGTADVDFVRRDVFGRANKPTALSAPAGAGPAGASWGWGEVSRCRFPVLESWDELPAFLDGLTSGGDVALDELQLELVGCYRRLKRDVQVDLSSAVRGLWR